MEHLEARRLLAVTSLVSDITDSATAWTGVSDRPAVVGDEFFFVERSDDGRYPLAVIPSGTTMAEPFAPAVMRPYLPSPRGLTSVGNKILFVSDSYPSLGVIDPIARTVSHNLSDGEIQIGSTVEDSIVEMEGKGYFFKEDFDGSQLWSSDGTEAGTTFIKEIENVSTSTFAIRAAENRLYFLMRSNQNPTYQLWKSDGTAEGTLHLKDIGSELFSSSLRPIELVTHGDQLFFVLDHGDLWTSDGTESGTQFLTDNVSRPRSVSERPLAVPMGEGIVFQKIISEVSQWWKSDGSFMGTEPLPIPVPAQNRTWNISGDGLLYYLGQAEDLSSTALFRSNGTALGTSVFSPASTSDLNVYQINAMGNRVLILGEDDQGSVTMLGGATDDQTVVIDRQSVVHVRHEPLMGSGRFLIQSYIRGTTVDSLYVFEAEQLKPILISPFSSDPREIQSFNERLIFVANDASNFAQIWTLPAPDEAPIPLTNFAKQRQLIQFADNSSNPNHSIVFFSAIDEEGFYSLWKTDGTRAGTGPIRTLDDNPVTSHLGSEVGQFGNRVAYGSWISDGTPEGTVGLDAIPGIDFNQPKDFSTVGDKTYFTAETSDAGRRLFVTKDTLSNARTVAIDSDTRDGLADKLIWDNRLVYLDGGDDFGTDGQRVWVTDGTDLGTFPLSDPQNFPVGYTVGLTLADDQLFFIERLSRPQADGTVLRLVVSDGLTSQPTVVLATSEDFEPRSSPIAVGSKVFFTGRRTIDGRFEGNELWVSDGTSEGTKEVELGSKVSLRGNGAWGSFDNLLYFEGFTEEGGYELWVSDGSPEGTVPVSDFTPGVSIDSPYLGYTFPSSSLPSEFLVHQNRLYYTAQSPTSGRELYDVQAIAPSIQSVSVNSQHSQRSELQNIEVRFDSVVQFLPGAVSLHIAGGGPSIPVQLTTDIDLAGTVAIVRPLDSTPIPDGEYNLLLDGTRIRSTGRSVSDSMLTFDSSTVDGLYQKYGDSDGDGHVGLADFAIFRSIFGSTAEDLFGMDYDDNGSIGLADFAKFRSVFGT